MKLAFRAKVPSCGIYNCLSRRIIFVVAPVEILAQGLRSQQELKYESIPAMSMNMESPNVISNSLYGPIIVNVNDHIGQRVMQDGYWAIEDVALLREIASQIIEKKGSCIFFDVGANIGTHTLALAKLGNKISVQAFEAQKWVYYMICGTVSLNSLPNVSVRNSAVGETAGELIRFKTPNYFASGGAFGSVEIKVPLFSDNQSMDWQGEEVVATITLDEQEGGVDLMKIDVEGMEDAVLRGGATKIMQYRPVVFLEIYKTDRAWVINFFKSLNYVGFLNRNFDLICFPIEVGWGLTNMQRVF
jgi:FkbM family methyltransferase